MRGWPGLNCTRAAPGGRCRVRNLRPAHRRPHREGFMLTIIIALRNNDDDSVSAEVRSSRRPWNMSYVGALSFAV
jgi:hypothetical protein